jgi:hypothetical protein
MRRRNAERRQAVLVHEELMSSKRRCLRAGLDRAICADCDEQCWIQPLERGLSTFPDRWLDVDEATEEPCLESGGSELVQPWCVDLQRLATLFPISSALWAVVNHEVREHVIAAARRRFADQMRHHGGRGLWGTEGEALAQLAEAWMFRPGAEFLVPVRPEPGRKRPKTRAATISWEELVRDDEGR